MGDTPKLTIGDLIAWGRDWERYLSAGPRDEGGYHMPRDVLVEYVIAANAALAQQQQREQERRQPRSRGGRPPGGMGEQKARLVAGGVREEDANRIVMRAFGKPLKAVQRAGQRVSKKTPALNATTRSRRLTSRAQKNPTKRRV